MKQKGLKMKERMVLFLLILLLIPALSLAQEFPNKPINILLGYAPGGSVDVPFRPLAKAAEKYLGQPIVISNNGAGGGTAALGIAAKEKPDGYHLEVCHSSLFTIVPHIRPVPYKLEEFVPIMNYSAAQSAFSVKADAPWKTLKEVVEYAKKNPGKFTYFGGAAGSTTHLAMEFVAKAEGVQFTMVPFQGGAPALAALLGGHINGHSGNTFPQAREGSVRLLAVQTEKRIKSFPNIPTFKELGYDFFNDDMFFIVAPRGTPAAIVKKVDDAFRRAMEDPLFIEAITRMELLTIYRSPEDLKRFLDEAYVRNGKMVEEFKIPKEEEKK